MDETELPQEGILSLKTYGVDPLGGLTPDNEIRPCRYCGGKTVRNGTRKNTRTVKHRFLCLECKRTFTENAEYGKLSVKPQVITLVLDLYFRGLSLRDISQHLKEFYGMDVTHVAVYKWIQKYMKAINEYVGKQQPKNVSPKWKADEQMVKVGGKWLWDFNIIDPETRYLLASNLTETRKTEDAVKTLRQASNWTKTRPQEIVTDGAFAYGQAIRKAYPGWYRKNSKVLHSRYKTLRSRAKNNNDIERYHSTFREFDKVRRGFDRFKSGKANVDNFRTYYNYIREHTELGTTPAEKAGIELELGKDKWMELLKKSVNS